MKVTAPYQVVLLVRGEASKSPFYAMPHEIGILTHMFGEANVRFTDTPPPTKDLTFDTADEYARLESAYKGAPDDVMSPARAVYRSLADFEDFCVENYHEDSASDKEALYQEAIALGIDAKKTWGIAKLQAAIDEAKG